MTTLLSKNFLSLDNRNSITIFTPTFNRGDKIHRVWESILSQSYTNFEWVIIDDGSFDNIEKVVAEYKSEASFPIVFHKFGTNKGKHNATNKALELANGKFFIVADSDDGFTPDALQFFIDGWNSIPKIDQDKFCGIRACCNDQFGNRVSDNLPYEPLDGSMAEAFYKHKFKKESWTMVLTDWHRKFLFDPNHKGYFSEGIIWKKMSREKKLRFFNKATRIYYIDESANSIMTRKVPPEEKISRNLLASRDELNNYLGYFKYDISHFIKMATLYGTYSLFNKSIFESSLMLNSVSARLIYWATMPLSFGVFLLKNLKIK